MLNKDSAAATMEPSVTFMHILIILNPDRQTDRHTVTQTSADRFCTSLENIATADDEDRAHFFVCQILGTLREGNRSNYPRLMASQSWPCTVAMFAGLLSPLSSILAALNGEVNTTVVL